MPNPNKETSMLIDIQYVRQNKKNGTPDYLYIIWKDLVTREKFLQSVPEPRMDIYFEKPELRTFSHNKNYERIENLIKKTVKYKDIPYAIAGDIGNDGQMFLNNIFQTKNYSDINKLFMYPYVFGADYDVRAWYRIQWLINLNNKIPKKLHKAFLDIEVDGIEVPGMPSPKDCPINAITIIDDQDDKVYTFLLIDRNQPQNSKISSEMYQHMYDEQEHMRNHLDEFISELHDMFDDSYGELDYKLYFYKDERKMLVHLFQLINTLKPDFVGIWNIGFDIPYIIERLEVLGLDPKEVMSHPDFPVKECYFKKDTRNHDIKNKSDSFTLTSYTIFYDQMELYAGIRKGASELRSYRLNSIAKRELRDTKLDYSDDGDIKTLPYTNYKKFVIYNIKDVLLQLGIERKTSDFDTLYVSSYENATDYSKVFKQTVKLRNVQYLSFLSQGLIPGNNINIFNQSSNNESLEDEDSDEEDESYDGALVADPIYNGYVGKKIYGKRSNNIFDNGIDFDMTAFYPSSIIGMNIDPSTLIFKTIVPINQYDIMGGKLKFKGATVNEFESKDDDAAKELLDNFQTGNYMSTGTKWLNMPDVFEVYNKMKDRLG